ncbi:MAG: hypothetical protein KFF77_12130 [Bacteroidetes bacterium]|nr:hypothetical protein [Bacteroidota bacterium]
MSLHRVDARNGTWIYYSREQILDSSDISRFRRSFCIQPLGADTLSPAVGKLTLPFLASRNDTLFCAWMTERRGDGAHIPSLKVVTADQLLGTNDPPAAANSNITLDIHPMPVTDRCAVHMRGSGPNGFVAEEGTLLVTDLLGRVMLRANTAAGESWLSLDTGGLTPGVYILRWESARQNPISRLFVKQ